MEKFRGTIEILSIYNLLSQKFAAVCQENYNFVPRLLFLTHDAPADMTAPAQRGILKLASDDQ